MKMNIIKKLNIIFSIIALIFSISAVTYADDTTNSVIVGIGEKQGDEQVANVVDLSADNFPELYKAWILELGVATLKMQRTW